MFSQIDIDAMQAIEAPLRDMLPDESTDISELLDASHRFAKSVCGMFEGDAAWSVLDLTGAEEFFKAIGYKPSAEAIEVSGHLWIGDD